MGLVIRSHFCERLYNQPFEDRITKLSRFSNNVPLDDIMRPIEQTKDPPLKSKGGLLVQSNSYAASCILSAALLAARTSFAADATGKPSSRATARTPMPSATSRLTSS